MAESGIRPANRVRFAFWAAEEDDLDGSRHYVEELSAAEISQTAAYLKDLDSCYHKACDTVENINPELLREMSGALGYAAVSFATAR